MSGQASAHVSNTKSGYSAQLVIQFPFGDTKGLIKECAEEITARAEEERDNLPTTFVTFKLPPDPGDVATAQGFFKKHASHLVRIYLIGHGDFDSGRLGGFTGDKVAWALGKAGFPGFGTISIIACQLALREDGIYETRVATSENTFAATLHRTLKTEHGIGTVVHARIGYVGFYRLIHVAKHGVSPDLLGHKFTRMEEIPAPGADYTKMHKVKGSKLVFYWNGDGEQCRGWAY